MKRPRAWFRTIVAVAATLFGYSMLLVARLAGLFSRPAERKLRNWVFRTWGRVLCRSFGMRFRVEGQPPSGRFFLVANHVSYLDIPFLGTAVDAAFVAKADLRGWPLLG
ncbi:MAG: 1-acyl-sn-glycerol-3-phosphate acyltransferase, partial [Holophagales bacterium]|nr:1-acyl-sn-glycerol-3-phosphate acyltransferase [Holophagales bacterium]